jgi:hypothetical protein
MKFRQVGNEAKDGEKRKRRRRVDGRRLRCEPLQAVLGCGALNFMNPADVKRASIE